jgi:hypothetical protein
MGAAHLPLPPVGSAAPHLRVLLAKAPARFSAPHSIRLLLLLPQHGHAHLALFHTASSPSRIHFVWRTCREHPAVQLWIAWSGEILVSNKSCQKKEVIHCKLTRCRHVGAKPGTEMYYAPELG